MRAALVALVLLAACSGDREPAGSSTSPDGGASVPVGADGGPLPGTDGGPPLPAAKGDPCRGVPLPPDQHHAPAGTCARLVAAGVSNLRQITFAPDGELFGVGSNGSIYRFHDDDDDGYFKPDEISKYASTGGNGNNCHVDATSGFMYAGGPDGVKRFTYAPGATSGGDGEDVVVNQPSSGHSLHTVHVYDGWLYVHSGSAGNATNDKSPAYDDTRSVIKRFQLSAFVPGSPFDWASGEVVTNGLRNASGYTRNASGRMFAVVNGLDSQVYDGKDVHDDNPGEQVVEIAPGKSYGYPFCFTAQRIVTASGVVPPGTQLANPSFPAHDDAWCAANSLKPATFIQAHSAPLDIVFFDVQPTGALPERWRGGAFVALHGSWNRSTPTGYKVVWIPFDAQGNAPMPSSTESTTTFPYEVVLGGGDAGGAKDGAWSWSVDPFVDEPRPAGVAISPVDGALYVATDSGSGMLYRIGLKKN